MLKTQLHFYSRMMNSKLHYRQTDFYISRDLGSTNTVRYFCFGVCSNPKLFNLINSNIDDFLRTNSLLHKTHNFIKPRQKY